MIISCKTAEVKDPMKERIDEYLSVDPGAKELFRVLMMSVKKFDKIDEERDGVIAVWLYPDSGRLMKVRPKKLTYLVEIDKLIVEDIQRWSFQFPAKDVYPTQFDVRYRVILRKTLSDEEIMKEVREKIIEKTGSR